MTLLEIVSPTCEGLYLDDTAFHEAYLTIHPVPSMVS